MPHKPSSLTTPITEMQLAVGKALAMGLTGKEVAKLMRLAPRTVDAHRQVLYPKVGVHNAPQLTLWMVRNGHIPVSPVIDAAPALLRTLEDALLASGYGITAPIPDDLRYSVPGWVLQARVLVAGIKGGQ